MTIQIQQIKHETWIMQCVEGVIFVLSFIVGRQFGSKRNEFYLNFIANTHSHIHHEMMGAIGCNEGTCDMCCHDYYFSLKRTLIFNSMYSN